MAATRSTSTAPKTTAERLAAYRAAAKSLTPQAEQAEQPSEALSLSEILGKAAADSRGFFSNVSAVYKVERKLQGF